MNTEQLNLRRILAANLKKQRMILGITQEKLAESAEISTNMVNDIEGCRTWVSDKTLIRLARALQTEIWRLFLPVSTRSLDRKNLAGVEIASELKDIKKKFDVQFENALKSRGFH
jgi:transcriptional regulator with XRE-family HTH domain